jgi:hypothetical protein
MGEVAKRHSLLMGEVAKRHSLLLDEGSQLAVSVLKAK